MTTNIELVDYVKKAHNQGWGYVLGTYGQILSPALLSAKQKQGYGVGTYNTRHRAYQSKYLGKFVSDCYGLVKGCVFPKDSRGSALYDAKKDRNQEGAYKAARVKGLIRNMPETLGLVLWMKGHAGVYIGNGEFIECVGSPTGMRKGRISGGRVVSGSPFTHYFEDTYIDYNNDKGWYQLDDNGDGVRQLQKDLKELTYTIEVDGNFGPQMQRVIRYFQERNGLEIDGSAGPLTMDTVQRLLMEWRKPVVEEIEEQEDAPIIPPVDIPVEKPLDTPPTPNTDSHTYYIVKEIKEVGRYLKSSQAVHKLDELNDGIIIKK